MQSTFSGIELGKRSLIAHTQGLSTIGHNVSNASVDGYSRQRVEMSATDPIYMPGLNRENTPGQIGQGVQVNRVERIRDEILENRIVAQGDDQGWWEARDKYILMVEQVYNEPTEASVRNLMDKFWESWQELSLHPDELPARQAVIERGQALADGIETRYQSLSDIRSMIDEDVQVTVDRVNAILDEIGGLNEQIVKIEAVGDNPNDLYDQRDRLVRDLSSIINITTDGRDPDEFTIHTGGLHLMQGRLIHGLEAVPDPQNEGYLNVVWAESGEDAWFGGGKLASLIQLRDGDVRSEIQNFDMMTVNFVDLVNENHSAGYGLNGKTGVDFFKEYPFINNVAGNYDRSGDGEYDSSWIFRINGSNSLEAQEQIGLSGTISLSAADGINEISYYPTDTVQDVVDRINYSGSEVTAGLNRLGQLTLKAAPAAELGNPDFVIRHVEDSGQFLVGYSGILAASGAEGAYDWETADAVNQLQGPETLFAVAPLSHPSGYVEISDTIKNDPAAVAAGFGENGRPAKPGDGSAAISIAALRNNSVMVGNVPGFDEYFAKTIADIGLRGETAERALETEDIIMKELTGLQESISGVNMDEELANMIKFQHGYTAAARVVNTFDEMLDTIINRMGV
ncbi:MAG: flagellar hook-associated protein FlgK [Spirochaetales bacterium]|uniref:Flagellar hook-associated protein 1 n=1 Tax=Candidatus Thalassospirochaeta sargassi TaxID=3119039 RepID=A0AAJ1MKP5_9SPIO|nr:flagellar hook-associated protein FlgK [Spirochaetales bacterium]